MSAYRPLPYAKYIPRTVDLDEAVESAIQAAFTVIAERFAEAGYEVTGDFSPGEVVALKQLFENFVRRMALNNEMIAQLNDYLATPGSVE